MRKTDDHTPIRHPAAASRGPITGLALAMVVTTGLCFDPQALPPAQVQALQALLDNPETLLVGTASSCCGARRG